LALALLLLLAATSGCYLTHLADGQLRLLRASRPVEEVLADPDTSETLREQLGLVEETRRFARQLGLEVGDQYTRYAAWEGDRIVTAVVAAKPGTVEAAGFWFPIVGSVPYKGFFDEARAEREAEALREEGMDVCVFPVPAYSTLGWFADPLTGPMLRAGPGRLVETVLHELVHATVYLPAEADFNEGVATFIGEEASVRFWQVRGDDSAASRRRLEVAEDRRLDAVRLALRDRVVDLYASEPAGPEREARRAAAERETREAVAALSLQTRDPGRLAEGLRLNDACLALAATYTADLPAYERRLEELGGDLPAFVTRLEEASRDPDPREALLGSDSDDP
jgi:predicted aminopeptidase